MKFFLSLLIYFLIITQCFAEPFYNWRYRQASTCSSLTDGKFADLCYQTSNNTVWKCVPSGGQFATCTTAGEWYNVSGNTVSWGNVTGDISTQSDLQTLLSEKQDILWQKIDTNIYFVAGNVSVGTTSAVSTFNVSGSENHKVTIINSDTTLNSTHYRVIVPGNYIITLPNASICAGREYNIISTYAGTVTINTTSGQTISGENGMLLGTYDSVVVTSDGSNWIRCS